MARIRSIKPEFWTDEKIVALSYETRLFFLGMWNFADDCGHIEDEPLRLKLQILPNDPIDPAEQIKALVDAGLVERRSGCLLISGFTKHQRIDKESRCRFQEDSTKALRGRRESSKSPRKKKPRKGGEGNGEERSGASLRLEQPRDPDPLFESVATVCDIDWHELTPQARGPLNVAVKQLRDLGTDAGEVRDRAANWPHLFPGATLTPTALAKHWPQLARARSAPPKRDRFVEMGRSLQQRVEQAREVNGGQVDPATDVTRRGLSAG